MKKDLSVLRLGAPKTLVVSELGPPQTTKLEAGVTRDFYQFKQGYSTTTLTARSVAHVILDLHTVFLWELAGMSLEDTFQGETVNAEVLYDERDQVRRIEYFAGAHLANGGPTLAGWMRRKSTLQTAVFERPDTNLANSPLPNSSVIPASAETPAEHR